MIRFLTTCAAALTMLGTSAMAETATPYAGQETREIARLSPQDVEDLLAGRGWGFAKSAELNGYPGPAHVLELAEALDLTTAQRGQVQAIFDRMNAEARRLGAALIDREAALDAAFESGEIDAATLAALTAAAGEVEAELRAVHLAAHLDTTPLLSRHQIMTYSRLRGYASGQAHGDHSSH
ncbi:MAG: Spy/CpxP family protein refolding chaperone [Pseudomonadota bacterium]